MHDITLISTIAAGFAFAFIFGMLAKRLGLSPILGYLVGGIIVGPHTPGFIADTNLATQLAELGVILLMFGVGMHFHWKDLMAVRSIAIPGALVQSGGATIAMLGLVLVFDIPHIDGGLWTWQQGLVMGVALAVASTVVLLRVLMDHEHLDTPAGHIAIGWLIVEDIITVLVLVVLPAFAVSGADGESVGAGAIAVAVLIALGKLLVLVLVVGVGGAWFVPRVLLRVARFRDPELFTLAILVMSIAVATLAYVTLDVSMALGAFLAGMLVGQSKFSHQAGTEMLPLRDAFAVLFFVSVGMLLNFEEAAAQPLLGVCVMITILVVKPLAAFGLVVVRGYSLRAALTVAGALSQVGEFSFILATGAAALGLLPDEALSPLVLGAIISISLNPFFYRGMLALEPHIAGTALWKRWFAEKQKEKEKEQENEKEQSDAGDRPLAIVIGYGPVGRSVTKHLQKHNIEPLVIEMNVDTVAELGDQGIRAIYGDATRRNILIEAGIERATYFIVTMAVPAAQIGAVTMARETNDDLIIITRSRFEAEYETFHNAGANTVCSDEVAAVTDLTDALLKHIRGDAEEDPMFEGLDEIDEDDL